MPKNTSLVSRRAWSNLRLAMLWSRKGGLIKNKLEFTSTLLSKGIKKLRHSSNEQRGALVYGDRELSFDDTPTIHVKMHRPSSLRFKLPHIPCIKPQVDFDYDFEFDDDVTINEYDQICFQRRFSEEDKEEEMKESIDLKADQFIAKFYEQMKLQRQISYLQYNENKLNV
ncbi:hypothetical protein ACJIZ3_016587 [Penstemon smallii]|uniref:Uncharacterized protein n=1 Tax=Penstemon smallii TaxID=265156 RepID=A0ABD3STV3_9LAMI